MGLSKERPVLEQPRTTGGDEPCKKPMCPRDISLKSHLDAAIKGDRLQRRDGARVACEGDQRGLLGAGAGIEERAVGRVSVVEQIVDKSKKLKMFVHLIGRVQVCNPVKGKLRILVGIVANKILGARYEHVNAELEFGRERIVAL